MRTPMGTIDPLTRAEVKKLNTALRRNAKGVPSGKKGPQVKRYRVKGTDRFVYSVSS